MQNKTAIIIVNYNNSKDTIQCLNSLYLSKTIDKNNIIIVVDNHSSADSYNQLLNWLKNEHDYIELIFNDKLNEKLDLPCKCTLLIIRSETNLGFAGGNNLGIKLALNMGYDYVLLLNNDTIVEKDFLYKMLNVATSYEKIGIVGCKICYYNNPNVIWFAGGKRHWYREGMHIGMGKEEINYQGCYDSDWVSGCAMLVRKEVFEKVGLISEDYFLYLEDTDFCQTVRKAGFIIKVCLDAKIYHKISASVGIKSPLAYYYGTRNRLIFASKYLKQPCKTMFYFCFGFTRLIRILQWVSTGRFDLIKVMLLGIKDFIQGKKGKSELIC